ncbi:hypothetical protein KSF_002570 [Reticulibacter mediterranei]|uniref:Carboxymuconolactone decarboxylase-like domain-containing protein n=1 Tax=Reticulibacter mediterranei TaxID=2778369 RepID=A0A8J3I7G3_9CHLR|nr:hypothetical protein [Reticulibacter mediterranei]GHO90209.1 hypothetical protein KSF_002570 [Reticulibacter mediterranei]
MRLHEVERGDGLISQLLIRFLSWMSGMRLPDAARVAFYHKQFSGDSMSAWTHAAMRGESAWSVGERELMAAMTAKWNACPFCIGAHGAIAARALGRPQVLSTLEDFRQAELSPNLQAILVFLEILTRRPGELTPEDAWTVLCKGVTSQALEDAIAVCALFHITTRCADTLDYQMLSEKDFDRAAKQLLVQGYAFGKGKTPPHPDHRVLADAVRQRILFGPGKTDAPLRQAMAERATGGPPLSAPYDELARQIGEAAYKVTDEQVAKVVEQTGSEKAAFELMMAAALGAGLHRFWRGLGVLEAAQKTA